MFQVSKNNKYDLINFFVFIYVLIYWITLNLYKSKLSI